MSQYTRTFRSFARSPTLYLSHWHEELVSMIEALQGPQHGIILVDLAQPHLHEMPQVSLGVEINTPLGPVAHPRGSRMVHMGCKVGSPPLASHVPCTWGCH